VINLQKKLINYAETHNLIKQTLLELNLINGNKLNFRKHQT